MATITVEKLDEIREHLEGLPPIEPSKRTFNKQEVVALLAGEIANLKQRGYTHEQIAQCLTREGVTIGTATLKSYLTRSKNAMKRGRRKRATRTALGRAARWREDGDRPEARRVDGTGPAGEVVAADRTGRASLHR
jgi:hypothetical protein